MRLAENVEYNNLKAVVNNVTDWAGRYFVGGMKPFYEHMLRYGNISVKIAGV